MKSLPLYAGLAAILLSSSALAATTTPEFVKTVSISDKFEIESSKLALKKSENMEVKSFAERMINDHTKSSDKLKEALAESKSSAKPEETLDAKYQKMLGELESASGGIL